MVSNRYDAERTLQDIKQGHETLARLKERKQELLKLKQEQETGDDT